MTRPRVILADDHTLFIEGLQRLLEHQCNLLKTVGNGLELVETAERLRPDVILLDISMPVLNGFEAARKLRLLVPDSKLIFLTMHADRTYVKEAFKAGASGYLLKRSAASELEHAIFVVLKGRYYLTPLLKTDAMEPILAGSLADPPAQLGELTPRQREVLQLVAEGRTAKQIAAKLAISVKTVEFHKARMAQQLGLRTTSDLIKYAIAHGITSLS
ncbi:MAG: response regulator transcription factor [Vicinamibacterales bacterium]|nr:response regulator transcription factor [Vicinamibacterales bacterium]